jgi:SPX domain protein involved in polyphosphate accumulation
MSNSSEIARPSGVLTEDFARYEFKYLLNLEQRQAIEAEIQHFMSVDGHVMPELDNQYFVRSLYFDSPNSQAFFDKIDGLKTRRKYRVRTYVRLADPDVPIFLEEKGRHNERTYKHRVQLNEGQTASFISTKFSTELIEAFSGIEVAESFIVDAMQKRLEPKILVDYLRRPYTSHFDANFRVTFDQNICATETKSLFPLPSKRTKSCVAGWAIMEVKFNRRFPAWFHRIIQAYDLRRVSVSKFVLGMKACGLAVDLS